MLHCQCRWQGDHHLCRVVIVVPLTQSGHGHAIDAGGRVIVMSLTKWQVVIIVVQVVMVMLLTQVAKG